MRRTLIAFALALGCSGSPRESGPGPVDFPASEPMPDIQFRVFGNAGREYDHYYVGADFAHGRTIGKCTTDEVVDGCRLQTCPEGSEGEPFYPDRVTVTSPTIGTDVRLSIFGRGHGEIQAPGDFMRNEVVHISGAMNIWRETFELEVRVPQVTEAQSFGPCGNINLAASPRCAVDDESPVVKWQGGDTYVIVTLTNGSEPEKSLACAFDAKPQKGQIPARALARLPRNTPFSVDISSALEVGRSAKAAVVAGRYGRVNLQTVLLQ